jgi:hypothetical protein
MKCDSHPENITRARSEKGLAPEWDKWALCVGMEQTAGLINHGIY